MSAIVIDGADDAIIGYADDPFRVVYDYEKLIDVFANKGDRDSGVEWVEFNVIRALAYIADGSQPVIVYPAEREEIDMRADELED
jgi:hypothetical protein